MTIEIKKGLDIPILGEPEQAISDAKPVSTVALLGSDYQDLKPTMLVREGDDVKLGQALFTDKKNPGFNYTSPGAGTVIAINRGAKRVLQSVVIRLQGDEQESFKSFSKNELSTLSQEQVKENLFISGLWTAFKTRPYGKQPSVDSIPHSIFVTATDTNPLAANPISIIKKESANFSAGLDVLSTLTKGKVFVCTDQPLALEHNAGDQIQQQLFNGPHPAGLPGTHIHFLDPVGPQKMVWHINYQDVIAIAKLFISGHLSTERIISLAGPAAKKPRLVRTRLGACISDITEAETKTDTKVRLISGSILSGRTVVDWSDYLGRYHSQISAIQEGGERFLFGYINPTGPRFSAIRVVLSHLSGRARKFAFTSSTNGSDRAMVPIGNYENIMPLDILPTQLLRALVVKDTDTAQALGCLELEEEDLALATFVSSSKYDYGPALRNCLKQIEIEG